MSRNSPRRIKQAIRTEAKDLLNTTSEFSSEFAADLGLHAFDPEEVERNVETQLEKRMGLDPKDIINEIRENEGRKIRKEDITEDALKFAIRLAKQDILRLPTNTVGPKRDSLLVKMKILNHLLAEKQPPLPPKKPVSELHFSKSEVKMIEDTIDEEIEEVGIASSTVQLRGKKSIKSYEEENEEEEGEIVQSRSKRSIKPTTTTTTTTTTSTTSHKKTNEYSCPVCQKYTTNSLRKLNEHLNNCLVKTKNNDDIDDMEEELGGVEDKEEDEEEEMVIHASIKKKEVYYEDDWNPYNCKKRLQNYQHVLSIWIKEWNKYQGQEDAHLKAEEAFQNESDRLTKRIGADEVDDEDEMDDDDEVDVVNDDDEEEEEIEPRKLISDSFYCPQRLYNRLLPHQRETLPWLFNHHRHQNGAILGDEMGLGKSAQAISFLASLKCSGMLNSPALIVAPATTLSQWVQECNEWHAPFRVFVLHDSFRGGRNGGGEGGKKRKLSRAMNSVLPRTGIETVSRAFGEKECDIIITTYRGLQIHAAALLPCEWSYVVLDEAHHIRNPDINVTLCCKRVQTSHRLALTGAPIQNRLRELWSLFDFVCPRKLGTLPTFESLFAEPIRIGGMARANATQVFAAFEAAKALRNSITPHMLRRMKKEVVANTLPEKTERVLFCNLTEYQRIAYKKYLQSEVVRDLVTKGSREKVDTGKAWRAITALRKICNHPDLLNFTPERSHNNEEEEEEEDEEFDGPLLCDKNKSAKMLVFDKVLQEWRKQGHKVLVFCQGTKMLNVLETYSKSVHWPTMRMDGSTAIKKRQVLISNFNRGSISDTFIFFLTTRVGGVGINLTGATRVMIFDPDWNPSTDSQARERAWRLGQTKPVTIYRLIVSGTIEEKIYHRQIFKQFLTNKVLHDPSQRRFFKDSDLKDLFTLNEQTSDGRIGGITDTNDMFSEHTTPKNKDQYEEEGEEEAGGEKETDNSLLKSLFQSDDAFREAFDHNAVELASRNQSEKIIAEKRAKLLARKARVQFLQEQEKIANVPVNVPTYTGGSGPPPTAAALIEAMRGGGLVNDPTSTTSSSSTTTSKYVQVLNNLRTHLTKAGKKGASSNEILNYGKSQLNGDIDGAAIFKYLLQEIADFDDNKKRWILKRKYM